MLPQAPAFTAGQSGPGIRQCLLLKQPPGPAWHPFPCSDEPLPFSRPPYVSPPMRGPPWPLPPLQPLQASWLWVLQAQPPFPNSEMRLCGITAKQSCWSSKPHIRVLETGTAWLVGPCRAQNPSLPQSHRLPVGFQASSKVLVVTCRVLERSGPGDLQGTRRAARVAHGHLWSGRGRWPEGGAQPRRTDRCRRSRDLDGCRWFALMCSAEYCVSCLGGFQRDAGSC